MSAFLLGTTIHDAETIDKLPLGAVVIVDHAPYQRIIDGDWYIAGSDVGTTSAELVRNKPALLVWLPTDVAPAAEADDIDLPLIVHGSYGGSTRLVNGDTVYAAPCGYHSPLMTMTGLFSAINCPGCREALADA